MEATQKNMKPLRMKIISMGNAEVGKSCIIKRYCEKRFVNKYLATIGIDYGVAKAVHNGREIKVNIFDMSGLPVFYEVRNEFYKDTQGALLVYDVSDHRSFEALDSWLQEMKNEMGSAADAENVVVAVCANKIDRRPIVDSSEGRLWADAKGFHFFETSAQNGDGITEAFQCVFENVMLALENGGKRQPIKTQLGYSKEQAEAIQRLKTAKDNYDRLGLQPGATKDDVNRAFRRLSVMLHPDKSVAPGSEEAFKLLVAARTALLNNAR